MLPPSPLCTAPMKDWIRNALSIRQPRRPAPVGSLPPVGALIMRGPVKMLVTHPLPAELWDWLVLSGWRNMPVKEDRRPNKASIGLSERWTAYELPVLLEIRAAIR